jgi:2-succinyl-6-hydroxy-2,4-cyclohexadiene-1-carboxylate synthase
MLVLLHGFAGTGRSWDPVVGHLGGTPYLAPALGAELPDTSCTLVGYSMGGRVALQHALTRPDLVERLVLVSATAGLEDGREQRRRADEELAARVQRDGIEAFADFWMAQPIFARTPPAAQAPWREDLLRSDPVAVAAQLREFGQGAMAPVWDRLHELTMDVDVVVGERDQKYADIGERLAAALPSATLHVIADAGHGIPREAPAALAAIIAGRGDRPTPAARR